MQLKNQMDHVRQDQGFQAETVERQINIPGLRNLHELSVQEIADVLANVLRAERNVVELRYKIGESITLVTKPDQPGYL